MVIPIGLLYQLQAGDALHSVRVQAEVFGQRFQSARFNPLYYPRTLWGPHSVAGPFGLIFMGGVVGGCFQMTRARWLLYLWSVPMFLYLQYGSMSLASYRPLFQVERYVTPLAAPLALLSASVLVDAARTPWGRRLHAMLGLRSEGRARMVVVAMFVSMLAVNSAWIVGRERTRHK